MCTVIHESSLIARGLSKLDLFVSFMNHVITYLVLITKLMIWILIWSVWPSKWIQITHLWFSWSRVFHKLCGCGEEPCAWQLQAWDFPGCSACELSEPFPRAWSACCWLVSILCFSDLELMQIGLDFKIKILQNICDCGARWLLWYILYYYIVNTYKHIIATNWIKLLISWNTYNS